MRCAEADCVDRLRDDRVGPPQRHHHRDLLSCDRQELEPHRRAGVRVRHPRVEGDDGRHERVVRSPPRPVRPHGEGDQLDQDAGAGRAGVARILGQVHEQGRRHPCRQQRAHGPSLHAQGHAARRRPPYLPHHRRQLRHGDSKALQPDRRQRPSQEEGRPHCPGGHPREHPGPRLLPWRLPQVTCRG